MNIGLVLYQLVIKLWWNDWETDVHMICSLLYFFLTQTHWRHIKGNKSVHMSCPCSCRRCCRRWLHRLSRFQLRLPAEQQVQLYRSMLWGHQQSNSKKSSTSVSPPFLCYCRPWQAYAYRHTAKETGLQWNEAVLLTQSRKVCISTYIVYICMQQPNYGPPWYCRYRTRN